jgi:hypothetical protein
LLAHSFHPDDGGDTFLRKSIQLLVTADVPSLLILSTLITKAIRSSETSIQFLVTADVPSSPNFSHPDNGVITFSETSVLTQKLHGVTSQKAAFFTVFIYAFSTVFMLFSNRNPSEP